MSGMYKSILESFEMRLEEDLQGGNSIHDPKVRKLTTGQDYFLWELPFMHGHFVDDTMGCNCFATLLCIYYIALHCIIFSPFSHVLLLYSIILYYVRYVDLWGTRPKCQT
jgi:hypothetical protein